MCVPIQRVHRDSAGVLTHVGGSTWNGVPWGLTVAEAVALQESRMYSFFVEVPAGQMVDVLVKTSSAGKKYLTTSPDGIAAAVDPTLLNCHTGRPDQVSCVYSAPQGNFVGDNNGLVVPWQIT